MNVAYDVPKQRTFLRFQAVGLAMTLAVVLCAVMTLAVLLVLRPVVLALGMTGHAADLVNGASLLLPVTFFVVSVALLYRFGPLRTPPSHPRVIAGAALATMLWLLASELLSFHVSHMTGFGATYGSLGVVIGVMLWLYVSAYAVLPGAELNACLEAFDAGN